MPIKFRCSYCRQFLGISRNRVGGIVDCPTCGRSIRVPGLDGVAAPLPSPELDRDDAHLARALAELAALADAPAVRPVMESIDDVSEEAEIPQPLPEPEPVELPMPVRMSPVSVIDPVGNTAVEMVDSRAALEELLQPIAPPREMEPPLRIVEQLPSTSLLLFMVIIPIVTLLMGLIVGWLVRGQILPTTLSVIPEQNRIENAVPEPVTGLEGRITYHTADGETRPDVGAIVIAVPETWAGQLRLAPLGLRPGDSEADQAAALKMAAAFGGSAARTDDTGRYQLTLPQPGRYTIVTMARFAERPADAPFSDENLTQLRSFLTDPAATIGQRALQIDLLTISANQIVPVDHAF